MEEVAISKFKAKCLGLLERVRKTGQPLLVTRRGEPVAQIIAAPPPVPTGNGVHGCMAETTEIVDDLLESLPEKDWADLR